MDAMDNISKKIVTIAFENYTQVPKYLLRVCTPQVFIPLISDVAHDLSLSGLTFNEVIEEELAIILQECAFQENTDKELISALRNEYGLYVAKLRRNNTVQQARRDQLKVPRGMAIPARPMSQLHKRMDLHMSRPNVQISSKKDYSKTADRGILDRSDGDHTLIAAKAALNFDKRQVFDFQEKTSKLQEMTKIIGNDFNL